MQKISSCGDGKVPLYPRYGVWVDHVHGFKNQTKLAGSTRSIRNQPSIWSGYSKKPKITLKSVNSANRPVQPENRKPERLNRFCNIVETDLQWSFFLQ